MWSKNNGKTQRALTSKVVLNSRNGPLNLHDLACCYCPKCCKFGKRVSFYSNDGAFLGYLEYRQYQYLICFWRSLLSKVISYHVDRSAFKWGIDLDDSLSSRSRCKKYESKNGNRRNCDLSRVKVCVTFIKCICSNHQRHILSQNTRSNIVN